jgi:hypothetical protein
MNMFDKFGEMDSSQEINELASNLKTEGDRESLKSLALENGIDEEVADAFMEGMIPFLCTEMSAALGKLKIEEADLQAQELICDWCEYIRHQCLEDTSIAVAVRKKDKSFIGCIAQILKWSFKHQREVDKDILKAAGVSAGRVTFGIPGMATVKKLITEYYLGK